MYLRRAQIVNNVSERSGSVMRCLMTGLLLLSLSGIALADAQRLYEVPLPPEVTSQSVAVNVIQQGHRLSMATLQNIGSIDVVFEFYRTTWENSDTSLPGYVEELAGDWHIISHIEDGWNTVIQIRSTPQGKRGLSIGYGNCTSGRRVLYTRYATWRSSCFVRGR